MPRRIKPAKHTPYNPLQNEKGKTQYRNQQEAEKAAGLRMLQSPQLRLLTYQAVDGKWYITSKVK